MNKKLLTLLAAIGLILGTSQVFAGNVNITVQDNDPTLHGFSGGPLGVGFEDNETESGTIASQAWDMEAFVVNGSTLYIVGGYNMSTGEVGAGGSTPYGLAASPDRLMPGDLMIKIGGANPGFAPTTPGATTVDNSAYRYSYAVDLTNVNGTGVTSGTASVYSLDTSTVGNTTVFNTVVYDQFGANPWTYRSGGSSVAGGAGVTYTSGLSNTAVNTLLGTSLVGGSHNVLAVDLGFLTGTVNPGTTVFFSYTMECGNDSLKGEYAGGFDLVPDTATSALLIGLGLVSMSLFGLKRRKV
jgi:hypothetical protein